MLNLDQKIILVSKRKINNDGQETFDTFFGKVEHFNENTVIVSRKEGQEEALPYSEEFYNVAEEGFYELGDGSTCENPDFIAEFVVFQSQEAREKYNGEKT
jgi:hypothetical protein